MINMLLGLTSHESDFTEETAFTGSSVWWYIMVKIGSFSVDTRKRVFIRQLEALGGIGCRHRGRDAQQVFANILRNEEDSDFTTILLAEMAKEW